MAQLVVAAAGAALGGFIAPGIVAFGMTGASLGWMAGSMLGSAFAPTQKSSGPQLSDLSVSTSAYGTPIPYVQGHPRIAGQIVWASTKREIATTQEAGKGGGGSEYTTFTYEVDLLILLTDNEIGGVARVWSNGELVFSALEGSSSDTILASYGNALWQRLTVYTGGPSQLPDPDYEAVVGTANAPAYRGRGSLFIKSLQLGGSGQIPNLTFEICGPQSSNLAAPQTVLCAAMIRGATNRDRKYGIQYTAEPTWASYWGESGDAAVNFYNDEPAGLFDSGVLDSGVFPIFKNAAYFFGGDSQSAGSTANGTFEFLNASGGVVGVIQINSDDPAFDVYYGASGGLALNTRGGGGSSGINGNVSFESGGIRFTRTAATNDSFFMACAGLSVATVRISNVRVSQPGYVGFGSGAVLFRRESLLFPLFTRTTSTISSLVSELCQRTGLAPGQFDVTALSSITRPVRSMAISSVSSARTVLDMLASSYHFESVLSDKIYFRPRASAPAATLTFNELGVVVDSGSTPEPLPLTQANELEIPAQMALTYSNVDGDYQTDTQYSDRLLTGQESTSAMQVPLGFTASEAKQIVDAMLLDKAVSALTTSVSLGLTRAALEPTDVVLLTGEDGSSYRMRIVKKAEASGVTTLECVQDDSTVFTQTGTTAGGTASQTTVLATPTTTLELLDVPLLRDVDNLPGHYAAVKGSAANWSSAGLYDSLDDLTYTPNTTISSQAVIGTCTTTLATWAGGNVFDDVSSVTVNVGTQQLVSVTRDDILASQSTNAALIGGEVLQYRTATLVSAGVYALSGFLRGQRTTPTSHIAAERFVLLGAGGLRFIPLQQGDLGRLRYYKAASAGQKLSAVTSQSLTPAGITLKPFAPVNARANRNAADTVLTWTRQTRLSTRIVGTLGISTPLGEAVEAYEVEIYTAGHTALLRTLTSSTPAVTYASAQQIADFGSAPASIAIKVYQISATVGRGTPLTTTV